MQQETMVVLNPPVCLNIRAQSIGWSTAYGQSQPSIWGLEEQPEDVFEDILEALLESLVAAQMSKDAPTENLKLGLGWALSFFAILLEGGRLFLILILGNRFC